MKFNNLSKFSKFVARKNHPCLGLPIICQLLAILLIQGLAYPVRAGTADPHVKEDSMAVYTVSSADELKTALDNASGGDVVKLAAGDYGDVSLSGLNFESEVTITSADKDDPAVFNTINIGGSSNLTFDSIFIDFTPTEDTVTWSSAFRAVANVSDITLRNSRLEGGDSISGIPAESEPGEQGAKGVLGFPIGRAVSIDGANMVIENNDVSEFGNGIVMGGDGISILGNEIHDLRTSPVRGGGSNVVIDGNYFHDSEPWKLGGKGDHGDYIHFWTNDNQPTMYNITITNNVLSDEEGGSLLPVYLEDNSGSGFSNVTLDDNVIHGNSGQMIRFENVVGASISRNTILNDNGVEKAGSQLVLKNGTENIRLEENIVSTFFDEATQQELASKGFVFANNLDINYDDPTAENFIGRIFADSSTEGGALWEKFAIPGSVADGLGSRLTQLEETPEQLTPVFEVERAGDAESGLILRADLTRGPDGPIDDSNARFIWDFGDGTGAEGLRVRHEYQDAGRYDATLTVVLADGTTATAQSRVGIAGEDVLAFEPDNGLFMAEGFGTAEAINGSDAATTATAGGHGVDLGGSGSQLSIGKGNLARLFGADSFDMDMTLRADTLGSAGEVARVHGSFILSVTGRGEVKLRLTTESDSANITTTGATVNDGADHDIRVAFDGGAESLQILVDGAVAAEAQVEGAIRSDFPRNLDFGNPWGDNNFDGTLTAFELDAASNQFPVFEGNAEEVDATSFAIDDSVAETGAAPAQDSTGDPVDTGGSPETPAPDGTPGTDETAPTPDDSGSLPLEFDGYELDFATLGTKGSGTDLHGDAMVDANAGAIILDGQNDYVDLNRIEEFEDAAQLTTSVTFQRENPDDDYERIVWNHMKLGISVKDDALLINVASPDRKFYEAFAIKDAGLDDSESHTVSVIADSENDRLQVVLDGEVVLDDQDTDIEIAGAGGREWGWLLGSPWSEDFEGSISDFQVDDSAVFVEEPNLLA